MVLYDGQLGKVFNGSDPDLMFTPFKSSYSSSVHVVHQYAVLSVHRFQVMRTLLKEAVYATSAKNDKENF